MGDHDVCIPRSVILVRCVSVHITVGSFSENRQVFLQVCPEKDLLRVVLLLSVFVMDGRSVSECTEWAVFLWETVHCSNKRCLSQPHLSQYYRLTFRDDASNGCESIMLTYDILLRLLALMYLLRYSQFRCLVLNYEYVRITDQSVNAIGTSRVAMYTKQIC